MMMSTLRIDNAEGKDRVRKIWYDLFRKTPSDYKEIKTVEKIKRHSKKFGDYVLGNQNKFENRMGVPFLHDLKMGMESDPKSNLPESYITIPILVSGLPYGSVIEAYLRSLGKSDGMVLLSHSTSYCEEGIQPYKVYIPKSELQFLKQNSNKNILLVDDVSENGTTLTNVSDELKKIGIGKRYAIVNSGLVFESSGMRSPTAFNMRKDSFGVYWGFHY